MRIEQSQLRLAGESHAVRQQVRLQRAEPTRTARIAVAQPRPAEGATPNEPVEPHLRAARLIAQVLLGAKFEATVSRQAAAVAVEQEVRVEVQGAAAVEIRAEAEDMRFSAGGVVETTDGRRIQFQAELTMSRRYVEVRASAPEDGGRRKDPLVLNFDGRGVRLREDRVEIDVNADGVADLAPRVASGSGVLFADRNGDRVAGHGSELFGPRTGDGFGELAAEDADGNGWIDEADPVFGQLRVWFQEAGAGATYSLADLGVGAISTSNAATQFDLRSPRNELLGQVRASGVYLMESGAAGVVSQVDLVA